MFQIDSKFFGSKQLYHKFVILKYLNYFLCIATNTEIHIYIDSPFCFFVCWLIYIAFELFFCLFYKSD